MISLSVGCVSPIVELGTPSSEVLKTQSLGSSRTIEAKECGYLFFYIFNFGLNTRLENAYLVLRAQAAGDIIANIRIEESWEYGYLGTTFCTRLTATAYERNQAPVAG